MKRPQNLAVAKCRALHFQGKTFQRATLQCNISRLRFRMASRMIKADGAARRCQPAASASAPISNLVYQPGESHCRPPSFSSFPLRHGPSWRTSSARRRPWTLGLVRYTRQAWPSCPREGVMTPLNAAVRSALGSLVCLPPFHGPCAVVLPLPQNPLDADDPQDSRPPLLQPKTIRAD